MTRFALVLFALSSAVSSAFADTHIARHAAHDRRVAVEKQDWKAAKRQNSDRFTFYNVQTGNEVACGGFYQNSDYIIAMNPSQYGSGGDCFKTVTLSYQGKSATAQLVDRCAACPYGAIDLSPSLFSFFADQSLGEVYGSWEFGSGAPSSSKTTSTHSSTTWSPPPTTTWTPTSTSQKTSSSSSWTSTSSFTSTSHSSSTSSSSSTASSAAATASPSSLGVIEILDLAAVQIGGLVAGSAEQTLQLYSQ